MGEYHINGGRPLRGEITIGGAKNAVLPIIAATLLCEGTCVIKNVPIIADVGTSAEILKSLGCVVDIDTTAHTMTITPDFRVCDIAPKLAEKMRSSFIYLGALLGRCGTAKISYPGGCVIGKRPVDLHIAGLRAIGCTVAEDEYFVKAKGKPNVIMGRCFVW
ncbi:hypothetical protein AGMMS49975_30110 [Clostridia bacterium]|nr:hypothetical protein AGMMS49975_30110 [Clostridia bacterium]